MFLLGITFLALVHLEEGRKLILIYFQIINLVIGIKDLNQALLSQKNLIHHHRPLHHPTVFSKKLAAKLVYTCYLAIHAALNFSLLYRRYHRRVQTGIPRMAAACRL